MGKLCKVCGKTNPYPMQGVCSYNCEAKRKKTSYNANKPIKQVSKTNKNIPASFSSKVKGEMLARDLGCVICRSRNNLDFHHVYFSQQANYGVNRNDLNQGVTICRTHHNMAHSCKSGEGIRQECILYLDKLYKN